MRTTSQGSHSYNLVGGVVRERSCGSWIRSINLRGRQTQGPDSYKRGRPKIKIWHVNVSGRQQEDRRLVDNLLQGQIRRPASESLGLEKGRLGTEVAAWS